MRVIRRAVAEFQQTARQQHPRLRRRMLREIASHILPERINRSNPRVVKRKISKFKRKRAIHFKPPKLSKTFREAVVVRQAKPNIAPHQRPIIQTATINEKVAITL